MFVPGARAKTGILGDGTPGTAGGVREQGASLQPEITPA